MEREVGDADDQGLGKYRKVYTSYPFEDADCGLILETRCFPRFQLYQDGESTPVSDLMARESHIFTVAPKAAAQEQLDWRLAVFEAGKYVVAFDGAALLPWGLWNRGRKATGQ
jgi:hypothetical protein